MSSAKAQYDALGSAYNVTESMPSRELEMQNARLAIKPLLRPDVEVLEFACGTGFYSACLLSWGAARLTAMDVSPAMLAAASARLAPHVSSGRVRFVAADGTKPQSLAPDGGSAQGYFDLAFGSWFLNYAESKADLTAMFTSIAFNLKPGGVFVGIVPHATDDLDRRAAAFARPPLSNALRPRVEYTEPLRSGDGWRLRIFLDDHGVDFVAWHLKKRVYEEAARSGGMRGRLEWRREQLLGPEWRESCGWTEEEWRAREEQPHFAVLVVCK